MINDAKKAPLLHFYPQRYPHDDVVIVSNREALLRLKECIDRTLANGEAECIAETVDFENYRIKILLNDEDWKTDFWQRIQLPFFDMDEGMDDGEYISIDEIIRYNIKSSQDLKNAQPTIEKYRKYSRDMTEKIREVADKNPRNNDRD